ncbi:MAG: magnesium/cobalt transporter CorA [Candidatus Latescibacteria bacterium]|nr:magnesium/cobalt transporter CorA [Candidatus Latescibacterota bacterium]
MSILFKRVSKKAGLPPGTLVHIGDKRAEGTRITLISYDEKQFMEKEVDFIEDCFPYKDSPGVTWINIDGLHDVELIKKIGDFYGFHSLLMEDIVNTNQRPKMDDYGDHIYIVIKMITFNNHSENNLQVEQVSLVLGSNYVISIQEQVGDVFGVIRDRLRNAKGRVRTMDADYLAYSLIDATVDNYFVVLENIGDIIEEIEDELVSEPRKESLHKIYDEKRTMLILRKSVWPLRELISSLERGESSLFRKSTTMYLKDVYDHTIQIIDTIETYRDLLTGMLDMYMTSLSNRMNEVMKVLTIIATIFIPLSFVVGVYGMNFKYMPELEWHWGYPLIWGVIITIVTTMLAIFRKNNWL